MTFATRQAAMNNLSIVRYGMCDEAPSIIIHNSIEMTVHLL